MNLTSLGSSHIHYQQIMNTDWRLWNNQLIGIMIVVRTNIHKHETSTFKKINAPVREKKKPVIGRILECISKQNTLCFNHTSFSPFYLNTVIDLTARKVSRSRGHLIEEKPRPRVNEDWKFTLFLSLEKRIPDEVQGKPIASYEEKGDLGLLDNHERRSFRRTKRENSAVVVVVKYQQEAGGQEEHHHESLDSPSAAALLLQQKVPPLHLLLSFTLPLFRLLPWLIWDQQISLAASKSQSHISTSRAASMTRRRRSDHQPTLMPDSTRWNHFISSRIVSNSRDETS